MKVWRFFLPGSLGFTLKNIALGIYDKLRGNPSRPVMAARFVREQATAGDPRSVLATLDTFARTRRWLMSVGPDKGPLIEELAARLPEAPRVLELGAYCGYSAIMLAASYGPRARGLVRSGTVVVADNVGEIFGAQPYLDYVRNCGHYQSENRPATIEYTNVKDAVEISTYVN